MQATRSGNAVIGDHSILQFIFHCRRHCRDSGGTQRVYARSSKARSAGAAAKRQGGCGSGRRTAYGVGDGGEIKKQGIDSDKRTENV